MSRISLRHSQDKALVIRGHQAPAKNSRPVSVIHEVACPECGEPVGARCHAITSNLPMNSVHRARHRLAVRKESTAHIATGGPR